MGFSLLSRSLMSVTHLFETGRPSRAGKYSECKRLAEQLNSLFLFSTKKVCLLTFIRVWKCQLSVNK